MLRQQFQCAHDIFTVRQKLTNFRTQLLARIRTDAQRSIDEALLFETRHHSRDAAEMLDDDRAHAIGPSVALSPNECVDVSARGASPDSAAEQDRRCAELPWTSIMREIACLESVDVESSSIAAEQHDAVESSYLSTLALRAYDVGLIACGMSRHCY